MKSNIWKTIEYLENWHSVIESGIFTDREVSLWVNALNLKTCVKNIIWKILEYLENSLCVMESGISWLGDTKKTIFKQW